MVGLSQLTQGNRSQANGNLDTTDNQHGSLNVDSEPVDGKVGQDVAEEVLEDNHEGEALDRNIAYTLIVSTQEWTKGRQFKNLR